MRAYEDRTHRETYQKLVTLSCDICGRVAENPRNESDWSPPLERPFEVERTTVLAKLGCEYPEGGSYEKYSVDICPECFIDKLIPWVESFHRVKIEPEEVDF